MKVLHLSYNDGPGGAGRAAHRLHQGLRNEGVNSHMIVQHRTTSDATVHGFSGISGKIYSFVRRWLDDLALHLYPDRDEEPFSSAWLPEKRKQHIIDHDPDIIHLHWIAGGFLHPKTIAELNSPVVWTFHDMWPFTGGCHYTRSCKKYQTGCEACPHLGSDISDDLSHRNWKRKQKAWDNKNLTVVAPSNWLADCARDSALFSDVEPFVIPNGLDTETFRPRPNTNLRDQFDIPSDTKLICFGAAYHSESKGIDLLYESLDYLDTPAELLTVVSFGRISEERDSSTSIQHLGYVSDENLRHLYSASDVVVVPSRQEAFGQTASEALASGTPVVAFDATGPSDIVNHNNTGYLAQPFCPKDLARGIDWVLADSDRLEDLSSRAREVARQQFTIDVVARKYCDLYKRITNFCGNVQP